MSLRIASHAPIAADAHVPNAIVGFSTAAHPVRRPQASHRKAGCPRSSSGSIARAAHTIREQYPDVGVLILSQHVETTYATDLLADNAEGVGYLLKDRVHDVDEFVAAVHRVATGGTQ